MPCDTRLRQGQSIQQRAEEIRRAIKSIDQGIVNGRVRLTIDRATGAFSFTGLNIEEKSATATDACILRRLMATGSAMARAKITQAEQIAGRPINQQAGVHSHDGGQTWHSNH